MEYVGRGEEGEPLVLDGKSRKGPGPMEALLLALAGCMAVDVQVVLEKSRVPLRDLEVVVEGDRAPSHPKRYTAIRLTYRLAGPEEEHEARLDRAIDLSRRKLCSVLHSLHPEIDVEIGVERI
jgi:putative redox protein